ncbi:MAG: DNA translocase FtsK, partial [Candidatus Babeliales bacterium]
RISASIFLIFVAATMGAWSRFLLVTHSYRPGGLAGTWLHTLMARLFDVTSEGVMLSGLFLAAFIIAGNIPGLLLLRIFLAHIRGITRAAWYMRCKQQIAAYVRSMREKIRVLLRAAYGQRPHRVEAPHDDPSFLSVVYETLDVHVLDDLTAPTVFSPDHATPCADAPHVIEQTSIAQKEMSVDSLPDMSLFEETLPADIVSEAEDTPALYQLPPLRLLNAEHRASSTAAQSKEYEQERARILENKLSRFGIEGQVVAIKQGPVITLFEYEPDVDAKISKILALEDDLALALQANSIRIIAPIPGKSVVGFEIARATREEVPLGTLMHSSTWRHEMAPLPLLLGVNTVGEPVFADLTKMPHLLVAGATGAGKSVALNVMLMSLLTRCTPQQLKLILIDPKRLEFAPYHGMAHLLFPIITQASDVSPVLEWTVALMQERYTLMAASSVRSIADYNSAARAKGIEPFAYVVVMIDELADLMITAGRDTELLIARLAQMARAAGIHLIVATQRPSVDVLTGTIKANFACRMACRVATKIDSRTIIDTVGAEKLLGKGDMLFMDSSAHLRRIHGAYVSDQEIEAVTAHVRAQASAAYHDIPLPRSATGADGIEAEDQKLFGDILAYVQTVDEISISSLQRAFRIGYNRSARMMELLEKQGKLLPNTGGKMRKVLKQ